MSNNLKRLSALVGNQQTKTVATVVATNADNTIKVQLNSGAQINVLGSGYAVNDKVYIEGNRIVGQATDLPYTELDI
ncbi:hypothetical protein [Catenovulum sediminis]|uniref:Uncharacterized protein n=1 Tax=Catenovulum sediminis TaxID=1740262 RepID=A0ABV1RCN9_9ALTE|nr:hypothetical protein [Catenovulum sediminis]